MGNFTIEASRVVAAPPALVWSVISNAGDYHSVVDTLEHTEIVSGQGHGMTRHCLDTKGREWTETCSLWNEGQAFRMTVDIDTYPTSFRAIFKRVEGTWSVTPAEEGAVITMRFDGETKLGPVGKAAVAAMGREAVLGGIMDGYESEIQHALADHRSQEPSS
ncbi:MAG: SRPBCC family protein [Acidimicrobiales bacterium]